MKKISILMLIISLSACYNLNFDALEYDRYVTIKQQTDNLILLCGTDSIPLKINDLKQSMDHQYLYSYNRQNRPQIATAANELKAMVDGLQLRYQIGTPSKVYCQEKLEDISIGTTAVIHELGRM